MAEKTTEQEKPSVVHPANNIPYLIAVVVMMLIAILGVSAIAIFRPDTDVLVVFGVVFGFLTPTTLSLLALMKSQETHLSVNSRLDEFMRNAEEAAEGRGMKKGREAANERTDMLAKKK
jgi:hypothetical protein